MARWIPAFEGMTAEVTHHRVIPAKAGIHADTDNTFKEYIDNYSSRFLEKATKLKKVQELEAAVEALEPYIKK